LREKYAFCNGFFVGQLRASADPALADEEGFLAVMVMRTAFNFASRAVERVNGVAVHRTV